MSGKSSGNRPVEAFTQRNNPMLPPETCAELTNEGVGVLDWDLGHSWDHTTIGDEDARPAARRSLENLQYLNENGGYGVIHTKEFEECSIGRIEPPCIRFQELKDEDGEVRWFKLFQFDEYARIDVDDEEFSEVRKFLENFPAIRGTLQIIEENEEAEATPQAVIDAYVRLDIEGQLEHVDY